MPPGVRLRGRGRGGCGIGSPQGDLAAGRPFAPNSIRGQELAASCAGTQAQLRQLLARYRNWKITAVPRQNADAAIALTAWGWLDKLDGYDEARITAFINAWRDRGPEHTAE